jgi:ATP-dependent Lon protease
MGAKVLDPEQNASFLDHYLDVPFDVSKVLFLVTANSLETIPRPLLDRMEVIQLTGYVTEEKIAIAQRYLVPRALSDCGLTPEKVEISKEALDALIRGYCREAGVRNLRQHLEKIFRKATLQVAAELKDKIAITSANLSEYVGLPVYTSDRYHERTPPGVVMALAWTSHGGQTMYIESIASKGSPSLKTTGHLGEVMTESSNIALSFAKSFLAKIDAGNTTLDSCAIHMHVPCGGTPKDGPSAGCAMVTSLLSLALHRPVTHNLAMTGEVTLTGKVLRIGGVREKIMAARRSGCTDIVLPAENRADFEELPDYIKAGVVAHFATNYSDIYALTLEHSETVSPVVEERTTA